MPKPNPFCTLLTALLFFASSEIRDLESRLPDYERSSLTPDTDSLTPDSLPLILEQIPFHEVP